MQKSIALRVGGIVFAVLLFSGTAFAVNNWSFGASPESATQVCSLKIDALVGIAVQDTVVFHLTSVHLNDTLWPKYVFPESPSTPHSHVWYWTNNRKGAKVTAKGTNWNDTLRIDQLYHATASQAEPTPSGQTPNPIVWKAFEITDDSIDATTGAKVGRVALDYEFKWEETDTVFDAKTTLTYTVTANP